MNSENIEKVTNQAIEKLIVALKRGSERNADAIPCGNWTIPSLQFAERDANRITETNGDPCSWFPRLAQTQAIREEARERHLDTRSDEM